MEEAKSELTEEYASLKATFATTNRDLKAEMAKNAELGMEILNLNNARVALMQEKDSYAKDLEGLRAQNQGGRGWGLGVGVGGCCRVLIASSPVPGLQQHVVTTETAQTTTEVGMGGWWGVVGGGRGWYGQLQFAWFSIFLPLPVSLSRPL